MNDIDNELMRNEIVTHLRNAVRAGEAKLAMQWIDVLEWADFKAAQRTRDKKTKKSGVRILACDDPRLSDFTK